MSEHQKRRERFTVHTNEEKQREWEKQQVLEGVRKTLKGIKERLKELHHD